MPNHTINNKTNRNSNERRQLRSSSASRLLDQHHNTENKSLKITKKRKKSESQISPSTSPVAKKPTHSKMSTVTLEAIQQLLHQQTESIKNDIQVEMKAMSEDLKASFHSELIKLNERVDAIESNVSSQLLNLKSDIDKCVNRLDVADDDFARITKLNELKITGIAHSHSENLPEIFCSIAKIIGYDTTNPSNMPEIARMQKRNQQTNDFVQLPLIIMKFVAPHIRNKFYGLYLSKAPKEPILTEHLNLPQGSTVRIGEVLTPNNQLIFVEAIKLKRDKKILKVNTADGLVRVKSGQTERFVTIKSKRELELYVSSKMESSSSLPLPANTSTETISSTPPAGSMSTASVVTATTNSLSTPIVSSSAFSGQ